ncbi:MAG: RecQ family ATP-dependent DNA helicase [Proteobacteria bacterium]|nr:RecQ family ATP-dependent DNA helicase [Pseudomonadota bacterium]
MAVDIDNSRAVSKWDGEAAAKEFLKECVLIDLEIAGQNRIFHIGAVFGDQTFERKGNFKIETAIKDLDRFCYGAKFLLGHNILAHDLPVVKSFTSDLGFTDLPIVDTLYLSPLAFPENPYHRLVKDYKLVSDCLNNPVYDARLAGSVFLDQWESFSKLFENEPEILSFYRFCFNKAHTANNTLRGEALAEVFRCLGASNLITEQEAFAVFQKKTTSEVCPNQLEKIIPAFLANPGDRPVLAYCLAWLRVAGGNSVIPSWVRHRFNGLSPILKKLRDDACDDDTCQYCLINHNPRAQLKKYFGYDDFRMLPSGSPLQYEIAAEGMKDKPLLGILPTGFGKSICYQLPGFVRFHRRGLLTVVISPLQALMKDQVDSLKRTLNTNDVEAINGMLTMPERGSILEQVRLGDIGILYISPEQLRNRSVKQALKSREIGCWVFDEAHCISKWGHDFRPDYLYAARFIREFSKEQSSSIPPVACYTATAKTEVIEEILAHFKDQLGQDLAVFQGGIERENLRFEVQTVSSHEKYARVHALLEERIGKPAKGSAVIYCATQNKTEEVRDFLVQQGWRAEAFHAGLKAPEKRYIQEAFLNGDVPVICATNAFGMGIDKNDVRLVIHADIPGSLENYLQEAGRAGRDTQDADCVLLYDESDIETQFKLGALSKLHRRDIVQILRGLRAAKRNENQEIIITTGELLRQEDVETSFTGNDYGAGTKVITAVAWLERAGYLLRNENRTSIFQGKPKFKTMEEIGPQLDKLNLSVQNRLVWKSVIRCLMNADPDDGMSADQIAEYLGGIEGITHDIISDTRRIIHILHQMAEQGIIQSGILMSAYIRPKGKNNARHILDTVCEIDQAMIRILREEHPMETTGEWVSLDIRKLNQRLINEGYADTNPELLRTLLTSIARDGTGFAERQGSIQFRHAYQDQYRVKLQRSWLEISEIDSRRRNLAYILLKAIYDRIPEDRKSQAEILVEFSSDDMAEAIRRDLTIVVEDKKMLAAIERGLLFLHEQKVIILQKGLSVFRQALTIRLLPESRLRRYGKGDYEPLEQHYEQKIFQVHVMNEYARLGMEKIRQALALVTAYFTMDRKGFIKRFFPDNHKEIERATSAASYGRIVESLKNPIQESIVCSSPEDNILILAGPGSGKTTVVIHRCAYLLRVERVPPGSILALCFNHSAALSIRKHLWDLIGNEARDVTVLTYHALAMRIAGRSFAQNDGAISKEKESLTKAFEDIILEAIDLLSGHKELHGIEPDNIRDRLMGGYRHILVDEYQDIDQQQYHLISVLAGRTLKDPDRKLSILAVGDDDQSIYGFRKANVEFIRRFQKDYNARIYHLVDNYRSTKNIINAANSLICHNRVRMKTEHPIRIDVLRKDNPPGGIWEVKDPVSRGYIQIFSIKNSAEQAAAVVSEIKRLKKISPETDEAHIAVFARNGLNFPQLSMVRTALEKNEIAFSYALDRESSFPISRIREVVNFLATLAQINNELRKASTLIDLYKIQTGSLLNHWGKEILRLLEAWKEETGDSEVFVQAVIAFIYESLADQKREQRFGHGVYLSTVHGGKGLEFSHVFVLDGGWRSYQNQMEVEEERRLYYVAMTRAKDTLTLFKCADTKNPHAPMIWADCLVERKITVSADECELYQFCHTAILGMKHLFLDFAGKFPEKAKIHDSLKKLCCGEKLHLKEASGNLRLFSFDGVAVAQLSKDAAKDWRDKVHTIEKITVLGLVTRKAADVQPEYKANVRCSQWEIPIVEISYRSTCLKEHLHD